MIQSRRRILRLSALVFTGGAFLASTSTNTAMAADVEARGPIDLPPNPTTLEIPDGAFDVTLDWRGIEDTSTPITVSLYVGIGADEAAAKRDAGDAIYEADISIDGPEGTRAPGDADWTDPTPIDLLGTNGLASHEFSDGDTIDFIVEFAHDEASTMTTTDISVAVLDALLSDDYADGNLSDRDSAETTDPEDGYGGQVTVFRPNYVTGDYGSFSTSSSKLVCDYSSYGGESTGIYTDATFDVREYEGQTIEVLFEGVSVSGNDLTGGGDNDLALGLIEPGEADLGGMTHYNGGNIAGNAISYVFDDGSLDIYNGGSKQNAGTASLDLSTSHNITFRLNYDGTSLDIELVIDGTVEVSETDVPISEWVVIPSAAWLNGNSSQPESMELEGIRVDIAE